SVTGSTINIGVPPEQLAALVRQAADFSEAQKKVIAKLEGELDLNQRQIRAALGILGENDIRSERLAAKLVEIVQSASRNGIGSARRRSQNRSPQSRGPESDRWRRISKSGCIARGCGDGAKASSRSPRGQRGRNISSTR